MRLSLRVVSAVLGSLVAARGASAQPDVAPAISPVVVGADRLLGEYRHLIEGKRLALVSNHSGRLADGTHLADALYQLPGRPLRALFGMEYDIRSNDYSAPRDPERTIDRA